MSEKPPSKNETDFSRKVGATEARKLKAQGKATQSIWSGFGMFGLVGWSVVVPTLLGTALGIWLDEHHPGTHSWTLTLLVIGLFLGCVNAWHWMARENKQMHKEREDKNE